jgi:hypothetical protein
MAQPNKAPGGAVFRPNHNFGDDSNRSFYIGQVEVPGDGLRAGDTRMLTVTFLNGEGLSELLRVGRTWRLQSGPYASEPPKSWR